jgi:hypothetical protein
MTALSIQLAKSHQWALSRSYAVLLVDRLTVRTTDAGGSPSDQTFVLAFGVLSNGESELVGAWPAPRQENANFGRLFDELKTRGVERIGLVVDAAGVICEDQVHDSYPSAKVWTSEGEATRTDEALEAEGRIRSMPQTVASFRTMNAIEAHVCRISARVSSSLKRRLRFKQFDDVSASVAAATSRENHQRNAVVPPDEAVRIRTAIASRPVQALRSN